ncbi:hypothetical protein PAGU1579_03800 [Veillonella tobetsuensis]|uniref:DUF4127 domain-containing protein n=1 Tax=Veillonella tobetsuensis TaxID=1110546 RepID=A0A480B566_9FIRM|nr:DUF4127 family protein [Veillonella tobetsuensis]GCL68611.1 hypothetical protein PAGU1579_03800 [Veillonella tobetsuensis]
MSKKWLKVALMVTAIATSTSIQVDAETVLFVPQDDRPVSLQYTVDTAKAAGMTVLTPPQNLISGKTYKGQADQIWNWVEQNAGRADVMVLSTDTLIYGGLVDSRKHNLPLSTLEYRLKRIEALKANYKNTRIYGFGTVMRSPRASGGGTEPSYYADYGPTIFQIAALQDKLDAGTLTQAETQKLMSLQASVPVEYLQDWFSRRQKNMQINKGLIDEARKGVFEYFALGHDDTSQLSQSALEGRYLSQYSKGIPRTQYGSFPGADQLGLLLMARSRTDESVEKPTFSIIYPLGGAGKTLPGYEDQTIDKTIAEHVEAVGGTMTTAGKPTVLLAVNTPLSTSTSESEAFGNLPMVSQATNAFVDRIQQATEQGVTVSVADIAYNNGSDNTLVGAMYKRDILYKIGAYNGWNTASNTVGYAIAQGLLLKSMSPEGHRDMLTQQYLDNWAYQANIRKDIYRMQDSIRTDNVRYSGDLNSKLEEYLQERIQDFGKTYLKVDPRTIKATFPWGRLFETDITVYNKPVVPLQKDIRLQREAEAKRKAEAEAAAAAALANGQTVPAAQSVATQPVATQPATPVVAVPTTQPATTPTIIPTPAAVPQ